MEIDRKTIEHVASVARLKLTEALEFFSQLQEIDTEGLNPSFQPVEIRNAMRDDVEKKPLSQDEALSLTEHKKDGYFKGPRAI
jgi:aspartyl-tRNA(Asn)/glutamyl-tRNA(Gln) amidotransferase subunit C